MSAYQIVTKKTSLLPKFHQRNEQQEFRLWSPFVRLGVLYRPLTALDSTGRSLGLAD
jgi:hypothetical protein